MIHCMVGLRGLEQQGQNTNSSKSEHSVGKLPSAVTNGRDGRRFSDGKELRRQEAESQSRSSQSEQVVATQAVISASGRVKEGITAMGSSSAVGVRDAAVLHAAPASSSVTAARGGGARTETETEGARAGAAAAAVPWKGGEFGGSAARPPVPASAKPPRPPAKYSPHMGPMYMPLTRLEARALTSVLGPPPVHPSEPPPAPATVGQSPLSPCEVHMPCTCPSCPCSRAALGSGCEGCSSVVQAGSEMPSLRATAGRIKGADKLQSGQGSNSLQGFLAFTMAAASAMSAKEVQQALALKEREEIQHLKMVIEARDEAIFSLSQNLESVMKRASARSQGAASHAFGGGDGGQPTLTIVSADSPEEASQGAKKEDPEGLSHVGKPGGAPTPNSVLDLAAFLNEGGGRDMWKLVLEEEREEEGGAAGSEVAVEGGSVADPVAREGSRARETAAKEVGVFQDEQMADELPARPSREAGGSAGVAPRRAPTGGSEVGLADLLSPGTVDVVDPSEVSMESQVAPGEENVAGGVVAVVQGQSREGTFVGDTLAEEGLGFASAEATKNAEPRLSMGELGDGVIGQPGVTGRAQAVLVASRWRCAAAIRRAKQSALLVLDNETTALMAALNTTAEQIRAVADKLLMDDAAPPAQKEDADSAAVKSDSDSAPAPPGGSAAAVSALVESVAAAMERVVVLQRSVAATWQSLGPEALAALSMSPNISRWFEAESQVELGVGGPGAGGGVALKPRAVAGGMQNLSTIDGASTSSYEFQSAVESPYWSDLGSTGPSTQSTRTARDAAVAPGASFFRDASGASTLPTTRFTTPASSLHPSGELPPNAHPERMHSTLFEALLFEKRKKDAIVTDTASGPLSTAAQSPPLLSEETHTAELPKSAPLGDSAVLRGSIPPFVGPEPVSSPCSTTTGDSDFSEMLVGQLLAELDRSAAKVVEKEKEIRGLQSEVEASEMRTMSLLEAAMESNVKLGIQKKVELAELSRQNSLQKSGGKAVSDEVLHSKDLTITILRRKLSKLEDQNAVQESEILHLRESLSSTHMPPRSAPPLDGPASSAATHLAKTTKQLIQRSPRSSSSFFSDAAPVKRLFRRRSSASNASLVRTSASSLRSSPGGGVGDSLESLKSNGSVKDGGAQTPASSASLEQHRPLSALLQQHKMKKALASHRRSQSLPLPDSIRLEALQSNGSETPDTARAHEPAPDQSFDSTTSWADADADLYPIPSSSSPVSVRAPANGEFSRRGGRNKEEGLMGSTSPILVERNKENQRRSLIMTAPKVRRSESSKDSADKVSRRKWVL